MTVLRNLYYAMWSSLSVLSLTKRAAIVLAAAVLIVWLIARPLLLRILALLCRLASMLVKMFHLICGKLLGITAKKSPERYAASYNRLADVTGRCNKRLLEWFARLATGHKLHLLRMFIVYGVLVLLVALPNIAGAVVSEEYIPYFSAVSTLYQKAESPVLERSAAYRPLFSGDGGAVEDDASEEPHFEEDEPEEVAAEELWLSLSEIGRYGSNLRAGPGSQNKLLGTLANDDQVLYLNEQSGGWVRVQTSNGVEGWIHSSLLTDVPAAAP